MLYRLIIIRLNPDVYRLMEHTKSAFDEAEELRVVKAQPLQAFCT